MKRCIAAILCIVMCICTVSVPITADVTTVRDVSKQEHYASVLKSLGLFRGVSETNFDLKRAPTRVEALVMLIRVLGEEQAALEGTWEHPFTDVPKWAEPYVGYAYETGLTKGISATQFGNGDSTAAMYLTFMLRALGYSDVNNEDFAWNDPYTLARMTGILTDAVDIEVFWRADAVTISYDALPAYLKNSDKTLANKLIDAGVFTKEQYEAAMNPSVPSPEPGNGGALTAMQISEKCAPAVFYVEIYAYNGKLIGSGSGFFISADGYAVTNYHIAANSLYMVITTTDGKKYDDIYIVDASKENDLALLKVNSTDSFTYLELGNSDYIKQGQNVYALGSPRGLENTLSQGIISNINRLIDGTPYMQISVPIDHGSSGGALINEYGKVIAVTTAGITDNTADLNLAVPIKYVNELDKSNKEDIEIWNDAFYSGFEGVYDFGAFTGMAVSARVELLPLGIYVEYDASDVSANAAYTAKQLVERCVELYAKALTDSGFVLKEYDEESSSSLYKKDAVEVAIITDSETNKISIAVECEAEYYKQAPEIPDARWWFDIPEFEYDVIDGWHCYEYIWSKYCYAEEFAESLIGYSTILVGKGFKYVDNGQNSDGEAWMLFAGNGYTIECFISDVSLWVEFTETETQTQAYYTLRDFMQKNAEYFEEYDQYIAQIPQVSTDCVISYSPEQKYICFSQSFSDFVGAEMYVCVFLCENGENFIDMVYGTGNTAIEYYADINRAELSSDSKLTPYNYTGAPKLESYFHNLALSRAISTLKLCEQLYLKPRIGITLADLGFYSID